MKTEKIHKTSSQTKIKRRQKILFIGKKSALAISDIHSTADKTTLTAATLQAYQAETGSVSKANETHTNALKKKTLANSEAWSSACRACVRPGIPSRTQEMQAEDEGNKQIYIPSLENTRERNASTQEIIIAFLSTADKNSPKINLQKLGLVAGTHPQSQHSGGWDKVIWATQSDLVERRSRVRSRREEGTRERILQSCHEHRWKDLLQVICKLNLPKHKDIHYYTRPSGDLF